MILTWFVGVHGLTIGFTTAAHLRSGTIPDVSTVVAHTGTMFDAFEHGALYVLRAIVENSRITFPLAIAEVILSALLVVSSGLAMGGRRGSRGLALQAILANAAFAIAAYVLTPFERTAYVEGVLRAVDALELPPAQREALAGADVVASWSMRIQLVFHLGALGLGALALTRGRTKTFFEAVARATETPEEP
jgi:hypothetical protein